MMVGSKLHKTTNYLWNRFLCEQSCAAIKAWNGTTAELQRPLTTEMKHRVAG